MAQDYVKAREWYEKAADKGDASAMVNLGLLYENGQGVAQDYAKAREWYEKAADKDNATPWQPRPALRQRSGRGAGLRQAREWYEKAAAKGDATPWSPRRALRERSGRGAGLRQGARVVREGRRQGQRDAMSNLGLLYDNGQGVAQDYAKAREWYEKAADKGDADAMFNLGLLYDNGQGVAQDYAKAREWYEKAAAKDNATPWTASACFTTTVRAWRRTTPRRASGTRRPPTRATRAP